MDLETKQKVLAIYFNESIPVHIVTWSDTWINGYILDYNGLEVTILDRYDGKITILISNIAHLSEFTGDFSTLKRSEDE